jgi:hypothetical protein
MAELRQREELSAIRPDLDGRQVMAHLGVPAGPVVGRALARTQTLPGGAVENVHKARA